MTNADLEKLVDTSDEWITSRTGIKARRIAPADVAPTDMAVKASEKAMEMAGCAKEDIELIITATVTPDRRLPSNSCILQDKLGLVNAAAFDIVAACNGFINGLSISQAYIENGQYKKILLIGVEKLSSITNYTDRNTCVLFGDGAGAVVIEASDNGSGIQSTFMKSDGTAQKWLWIDVGSAANPYQFGVDHKGQDKILMSGADIFKVAVKEMGNAINKVLDDAGLTGSDISLFVPHQANIRIIEAMARRLKLSMDNVFLNIEDYGNTSAASVPIALDEANRSGRLKPGDNVVMVAFGGGLVWGSALVRW